MNVIVGIAKIDDGPGRDGARPVFAFDSSILCSLRAQGIDLCLLRCYGTFEIGNRVVDSLEFAFVDLLFQGLDLGLRFDDCLLFFTFNRGSRDNFLFDGVTAIVSDKRIRPGIIN